MTSGEEAAIDAARRRVGATLEAARRIELERLIVGVAGPETESARRRAFAAARSASRSALIAEAREAALAYITQAFSARAYSGTWAVTEMSMSVTRAADRAAVAEALADAVTADAVEDLIDAETADALRATWSTLANAGPIPEPGALSGITTALVGHPDGRPRSSLTVAIVILIIGLGALATGSVLGIAIVAAGAVVLRNALHGRAA